MNNRVKIQYRKPLLELCSPNKKIETVLTDRTQMSAYNITLVEKVNETTELTFSMPFENTKINNQDCEKLVKLNGEYYVIKEISVSDANSRVIEVKCIHESVELKGILCETIDVIGVTASEMFKAIKDSCTSIDIGYEFKGTDIPDTTKRALQNDNEVSVYENLVKMAEVFQAVLEFSTNTDGVKQIYLRKGSIERGKYLKKSNGLKQLNLTYDSNELFTRVIPFGYTDSDGIELNIMGVSPTGKSYVENYDYFLAKGMTYDEIKNNPRCNQEMIYRDTNIVDEHDLYRLAMEELEKCSVPVLNGSIDMVDFSIFEGSALLAPVLCEEIIVIDKDINFSIKAKITGIERNYDNPLRTRVEISNVIKYNSVFKDLVNAGNKIDKITSSDSEGNIIIGGSFVQGKINAHKTQIVGMLDSIEKPEDKYAILFEDRRVGSPLFGALAIGSRGILIANEVDGKEEWIWRTAINANAISASEINTGVLNADLIKAGVLQSLNEKSWIDMDDGSFSFADGRITYNNTDGFKIFLSSDPEVSDLETELNKYKKEIQNDINDIASKLDSMDEEFWDAFADGIIDEAEANMIKQKLLDLNKEKADIDSRYNTVYNNVNLINPAKKSLYNAYNNFTTKHNNLISTIEDIIADEMSTVSEMEQFKKAFDAYIKTTPTLSKAFDDAVTNISYNMTTTQINDYNTLVQEDIKHVSDSVDNLEDVMNSSFRDGIIDEAEYIAIIESMSRLQSEKTDIDKNFDSLYSNLNLTGTSKTNLKSKYDAYVLAHDTLINYVNNSIGDKIATEEEKAEIKSLLTVYDTALGEFGVAQTQAINNIADNSANNLLEEYKKEVDADIKDINDKLSDLEDGVTDAIYDGIIEEAEAIVIENSIKELNKEKQDIKVRYDEIYKNSGLSSSGKSSLKTAYTAYSTAHTALINQINDMIEDRVATSAEKIEYEECIKAYDDKFSALSKAFDNALNEIALNNANTIMEALKKELQANIKDVEDIAKSLKEQLGDFTADGILDEAEKQSIKTMLKTLATEKSDVTNQYNTVYTNPDLTGTAKSNLSTAYVNYNSGYNSLITVIESILSKDSISDGDRTTLDTSFATHDNYLAVYSKRVSEAIDAIAKKKKEDAITESKDYYDAQIKLDKDSILATVSRTYSAKEEVDTLANEIRNELSNIGIGGRNYIQFSDFKNNTSQWIQSKNSENTGTTTVANGVMTIISSGTGYIQRQIYSNKTATALRELEKNKTYTLSIEIMMETVGTGTNAGIDLRFNRLDNTTSTQIRATQDLSKLTPNVWTKIQKTATINWSDEEFNYWRVVIQGAENQTIHFRKPKLELGDRATDWTSAVEDTETYVDNLVADLQEQLDGKIETYSQPTDPSTNWTTTQLKNKHLGDIWYNTSTKLTYRWSGTAWVKLSSQEAIDASNLASKKAQVFTGTPTIPYFKGDLWITALDGTGVVKTCVTTRTTGSYTSSDWKETLKYTDNTLANKLQEELNSLSIGGRNYILNGKGDVKAGFFKNFSKVENGYGEHTLTSQKTYTNVGIGSGFILDCRDYEVGKQVTMSYDIMYTDWNFPSGSNRTEFWIGQRYTNATSTSSVGAWKGVTQHNLPVVGENGCELNKWIHIEKTMTIPEQAGEGIGTASSIQFYNSNADVSASITFRIKNVKLEYGNRATDWTPAVEDTETYIDDLVVDLQRQLDGKIETYSQSTDPSTYWTTEDVKLQHEGDLWYKTTDSKTYRWNGSSWVYQPEAEELAKSKKRIFNTTPTVPYDSGDLWILQSDTAHSAGKKGEILTCSTAKASGSYSPSDWIKTISYTDNTYAVNVESKLEQRAEKIELSVTEIRHDAYDIIPNGDFSATSTTNWVSSNITKSGPSTLNSKRWLRLYNTTETITTDGICSCEFTLKYDTTYSFNLLVAQRLSSMTFYRVTVEGFNSATKKWLTIKTWTGSTIGTTASPTSLTYSYTYPTGSSYSKFRLAVKRLTTDPVMDIYITGISVTCKDSLVKSSQIKILSDSIESKVSSGDLGTLIKQNYEAVKIAWNNNSKYVQFENGGMAIYNASVSNSQKRAFINENGVNYWRDGYQLGRIGTNTYSGDSTKRGIVFDLDHNGSYMTWASKKESTETTYKMRWTYVNKNMGSFRADCLNAGCDIYMGYYDIIDSELQWSKNTDLAEIYFYSANDEYSQLRLIIGDNTNDTIGMYYKGTDFNTTNQIYTICDWSYGGSYVYTNLDMNNHSITNTGIVTSYNFNQLEEVTTFATYENTDDYSQETLLLNDVTTRQAPITRTLTRAIVPNIEWSGSATVLDGVCNLQLPNDVHYTDYTIVITPIGNHHIYVHEKQDDICVIKGDDCEFDFIIKFAQPESSLVRDLTTGIVGRVVKCESEKYKEKPIEMILKQE